MARTSDTWQIAGVPGKCLVCEPGEGCCLHPIRIKPERFGSGDRDAN